MTFLFCLAGLAILIFGLSRVSIGLEQRGADRLPITNDTSSLESELEAALERESHGRHWEWTNTPIGIWILTTIAAGTVGYMYTNYSVCRTAQSSDDDTITRIVVEASLRSQHILTLLESNKGIVDDQLISKLDKYLNENNEFVLRKFKQKSAVELDMDTYSIYKKWGIDKDNRAGVLVGELVAGLMELYLEVNTPVYEAGETPDKDDIKKDIVTLEPLADLAAEFRYFIPPSLCLKKAVWPF
jgi:hypothetical protein